MALARPSKFHGPISPNDADLLDLTTIAALLGVGNDDFEDFGAAAADLNRRRMEAAAEGRTFTWE